MEENEIIPKAATDNSKREADAEEQFAQRLFYKRQYNLTEEECDILHMHYSPTRVPPDLSEEEIKTILHRAKD